MGSVIRSRFSSLFRWSRVGCGEFDARIQHVAGADDDDIRPLDRSLKVSVSTLGLLLTRLVSDLATRTLALRSQLTKHGSAWRRS